MFLRRRPHLWLLLLRRHLRLSPWLLRLSPLSLL
jgi:hypothetical protein